MNLTRKRLAAAVLAGLLFLSLATVPAVAREAPKGRWLKIRVYARGSSTPTVLVNLPMSLVSVAVRVLATSGAAQASIDGSKVRLKEIDVEEFLRELESLEPGRIVEVQEDDDRVSIWIE